MRARRSFPSPNQDGTFIFETNGESVTWNDSSAPATHWATCDITRNGHLKVIQQNDGTKDLEFDVNDRQVMQARSNGNYGDPAAICEKAVSIFSQGPSLFFKLLGQENGAFLMGDPRSESQMIEATGSALTAQSLQVGAFSFLFTPGDHANVDVTDLVAPQIAGVINEDPVTSDVLTINSQFRTLRLQDPQCGIDMTIRFLAISSGTKVSLNDYSPTIAGEPILPNESQCDLEKAQLKSTGTQLFDVTDPMEIAGQGSLGKFEFTAFPI